MAEPRDTINPSTSGSPVALAADQAPLEPLRRLVNALHANDVARPFSEPLAPGIPTLQARASLFEVVRLLQDHACVCVAENGTITGVITRHDLERLPGRAWLFGIVTSIELFFNVRIAARWSDDDLRAMLTPSRLDRALKLQAERQRRGEECRLLDCIQLADKGKLMIGDPVEYAQFRFSSRKEGRQLLKDLELLRNALAHAQDFVAAHWPTIANLSARAEVALAPNPASKVIATQSMPHRLSSPAQSAPSP